MHHGAASPPSDGGCRAVVMPGQEAEPVTMTRLVTARLRLDPVAGFTGTDGADDTDGDDRAGGTDVAALFALHADPRAFVEDSTAPLTSPAQMRWVLREWCRDWERHGIGHFTVRALQPDPGLTADERAASTASGSEAPLPAGLLGVVGLSPMEVAGTEVLSAYWRLDPRVTGRGVATEAMHAVLDRFTTDHSPAEHADREIIAVTAAGNTASLALAARLGFRPAPSVRPVPGGREGDVLLVLARTGES